MVLFDNPAVKCHLVRKLGKYCIDRRGLVTSSFKIFRNVNGAHQMQRATRAKWSLRAEETFCAYEYFSVPSSFHVLIG